MSVHVEPGVARSCFSSRAPLVREWFTINKAFYLGACHGLHSPRLALLWSCSRTLWKNIVNSLEECEVTEGKHNILMCQAERVQHDMLRERYGREREEVWKRWTSSESAGKAGKATLGYFQPIYHEVDMCFTVKGYVSSNVGTHSGILNSIELHAV